MVFYYIGKIFSTNKNIEDGSKKLISDFKKIKSDIKYLEENHSTFILKSLIADIENFSTTNNKCWKFSDYRENSACLEKYLSTSSRYNNLIRLKINHNNCIGERFRISSIEAILQGDSYSEKNIKLNTKDFRDIILQYFLCRQIIKSRESLDSTKKSFDLLSKIIGKDVYRDSKIEEILK